MRGAHIIFDDKLDVHTAWRIIPKIYFNLLLITVKYRSVFAVLVFKQVQRMKVAGEFRNFIAYC